MRYDPHSFTGFAVIRFSCPNCQRDYYLADALAHLPLLCKGCGQRLEVPEPTKDEPPPPVVKSKAERPVSIHDLEFHPPTPTVNDSEVDLFMTAELKAKLKREAPKPLEKPPPPVHAPEHPAEDAPSRRSLGLAVDVVVTLVLLGIGMLIGEMVAGKPTSQILSGITGPKFPPMDFVLWLGCVGFFGLVYAWLGTRGWTIGAWLKRHLVEPRPSGSG